MKEKLQWFMARAMIALSVFAVVPVVAHADTESRMYVDCYDLPQPGVLYPGAVKQDMLWIATANMGMNNLRVSKVGVSFTGTATASDIPSVTFYFTNVNGNVVTAGTANVDPVTKTAELTGSPLYVVPEGYSYDVIAAVNVSAGAVLGRTAQFGVKINNFDYLTNTPPSLVSGNLPCSGYNTFTITTPPATPAPFAIQQPNGGEILKKGVRYSIKWNNPKLPTGGYFCKVDLIRAGVVVRNIRTMSSGYGVLGIVWAPEADIVPANNYRVRAYACNSAGAVIMQDTSDANFRITN